MRVLLVSLNSKYVHTNLAIRCLKASAAEFVDRIELREFTINERVDRIAAEIYESGAEVIGFSCYIWNIDETKAVIRRLRRVNPRLKICLGGPEVSFDSAEILSEMPEVDAIVYGEGEQTFLELLRAWRDALPLERIPGLAWHDEKTGRCRITPSPAPLLLASLPNPYTEEEDFRGRLVYVETTRGCPFNCQYCLSSTFQGVRFFPAESFRPVLRQLLRSGARTIKFVDRTFNADKRHALEILDVVREEAAAYPEDSGICAHCEIAGELLDQEWIDYLDNYPSGLVQFEVGVQSTNPETLRLISRPQHFERWGSYVREIESGGKFHLHLDLIAGLPEEDWSSFRKSFNDVYEVKPDMLQLGFLKMLKGSGLRNQAEKYGLVYAPDAPYTILQTRVLTHAEMLKLQRLEEMLEKYYNSGKFASVLPWALQGFAAPFDFYHGIAEYWQERGWFRQNWPGKALFEKLWEFLEFCHKDGKLAQAEPSLDVLREHLRLDYYLWERPQVIPDWLCPSPTELPADYTEMKNRIQQDEAWLKRIPQFASFDRRQRNRATAVEYFAYPTPRWILFFYRQGKVATYIYEF